MSIWNAAPKSKEAEVVVFAKIDGMDSISLLIKCCQPFNNSRLAILLLILLVGY